MATRKLSYSEPSDYFPKSVRKEFKIGEYAEPAKKTPKKKTTPKKTSK